MPTVEGRIRTVCLVVIATILGAVALRELQPALIPFTLAVFLTYAVAPVVDVLNDRLRVPRILAIALALFIGFCAFSLLGGLISSSVHQLRDNIPQYRMRFDDLVGQVTAWLSSRGVQMGADSIHEQLRNQPFEEWAVKTGRGVADIVSNTFLVLVFSIYLLLGHRADTEHTQPLRATIEARIQRYIVMKVGLSAITGVLVWLTLAALGVDLALVFGVLAFVLNFIPSVGSIIATLLPLPVVLFDPDATGTTVLLAMVLPETIQMLVGNVIEPKLMGESLELHPVTILLALVFWGILWGIPGMLLGTPITAVLKILMAELEFTRPIAELMAGHLPGADAERVEPPPEPPPSEPPSEPPAPEGPEAASAT